MRWRDVILAGLLQLAATAGASAHAVPVPEDQSGVSIPAINHGAMAVLERYRDPILDLARSSPAGTPDIAALLTHNDAQRAACLWLLVPGSLTDEASSLNLCAHAETAGLKAILDRLVTVPGVQAAALDLQAAVEWDMILGGTSLEVCEHSGAVFNTATLVRPDWSAVASSLVADHPAVAPIGLTAAAGFCLLVLGRARLRSGSVVKREV